MKKMMTMMIFAVAILFPMHDGEASMTATNDATTTDVKQETNDRMQKANDRKWKKRRHYTKQPQHQQAETPKSPSEQVEQPSVDEQKEVTASQIEQEVLTLTNKEREKAGLQPLKLDDGLMASAREKSLDMAKNNYFSHTSPTYGSPFDQMKQHGVTYRAAAENIAKGQQTAKEVVQAWMESPGHRQNILTPNFTHIGIGFSQSSYVWTQQFIQK